MIMLVPYHDNKAATRQHVFAVMAIFRNESHILVEWIEHYLMFGADHIYLINNRSTDDCLHVLSPYLADGRVSLFSCDDEGCQISAYSALLPLLCRETEWVGVFDLDEFIYPVGGGQIPELLERHGEHESILIPWLSFGSNGHLEQPPSVIDGFFCRGPGQVSRAFVKAIVKPSRIIEMCQHNPRTIDGKKILSNGKIFGDDSFITLHEDEICTFTLLNNHYRLQSRQYFMNVKVSRPEVHESVKDQKKKASFFDKNDSGWNIIVDTRLRDLRNSRNLRVGIK